MMAFMATVERRMGLRWIDGVVDLSFDPDQPRDEQGRWSGDSNGTSHANAVAERIISSGVGADYVHELYGDDPEDAILTNFPELSTVRHEDIEQAREFLQARSQTMLRLKYGDTLTAYRGTTGTESSRVTTSLSLSEHTAKFHARGKPVVRYTVKVDHVLGYSEAIGRGTFAEEEIVVRAKSLSQGVQLRRDQDLHRRQAGRSHGYGYE